MSPYSFSLCSLFANLIHEFFFLMYLVLPIMPLMPIKQRNEKGTTLSCPFHFLCWKKNTIIMASYSCSLYPCEKNWPTIHIVQKHKLEESFQIIKSFLYIKKNHTHVLIFLIYVANDIHDVCNVISQVSLWNKSSLIRMF